MKTKKDKTASAAASVTPGTAADTTVQPVLEGVLAENDDSEESSWEIDDNNGGVVKSKATFGCQIVIHLVKKGRAKPWSKL